ncbi:MAG: ester cyclase [Chitinophagaceae bacterium]|nr:ester cyclase [Chitinophagaceae bacterium]
MKKILFVSAAAVMLLAACGGKHEGGVSETTKKNLEVNAAIAKCFETKDFSKLGDYLSEEFVDYAGEMGPVKGVAANKAAFEKMMSTYDSAKTTTLRVMGDDEYVMALMEFSGVMKVDMMGMKAGQSFKTKAVEMTQFKDGKAIAHWTYMEPAEMMKMMGGAPPPNN